MNIRHYRYINFLEWQNKLVEDGFLKTHSTSDTKIVYCLKAPLQILITSQVVEKIRRRYKPDREIGGILLAEPVKIGTEKILLVNHISFIRNVSKDPRKYQAIGDRTKHMHRCLMGTKNYVRYFPIWFHSHLRKSKNLPEPIMTFFEMSTSNADKQVATRKITYLLDKKHLSYAFPSALIIVTHENKTFIGVYGGFIAPDDFREYVQKMLGKSMEEIIDWGLKGESVWRAVVGILGGFGVGLVGGISHPGFQALANQIAIMRKELDADPNYFTTSENHDLKIIIPESS